MTGPASGVRVRLHRARDVLHLDRAVAEVEVLAEARVDLVEDLVVVNAVLRQRLDGIEVRGELSRGLSS